MLKTWPSYYKEIKENRKTFEMRLDDRDFKIGDLIVLEEYDLDLGYSGRSIIKEITHILSGPKFGLMEGWVILSFKGFNPNHGD